MLTDAAAVLGLQVVLQGRLKTRFYKYDFFFFFKQSIYGPWERLVFQLTLTCFTLSVLMHLSLGLINGVSSFFLYLIVTS